MNSGIEEEELVFITNIYCNKIDILIITFIQVVMKMDDLFILLQDYRDTGEPGCQYLQEFVYENSDSRTSTKTK